MALDEHQDDMTKAQVTSDVAVPSQPVNNARRRFAKSGLAASGIILTLRSRSVMAGTVCKSPSGFLSGNQSSHGPQPIACARSPGYWKEHPGAWPISTNAKFNDVFGCSYHSPYAKYTMMQVLTPQQDDKNGLGRHLVAALLNSRMGWTPFLTEERIRSMFTEWQATGYFSPTANVQWNAAQIVDYLRQTMI